MSKASEKLKAMAAEHGLAEAREPRKVVQLGRTYVVREPRRGGLGSAVIGQRMLRAACSSLEEEMLQTLIELEVASNGTTTSFDSSGGGTFGSKVPISGGCDLRTDPPHIFWRKQWDLAVDEHRRREVVRLAQEELQRLRKAPERGEGETEEQRDERLIKDGESWTVREVANQFKVTESMVRRIRRRHGRDPERGMVDPVLPMPNATPEERQERVLLLSKEHRMSDRMIASLFGVSHETIRKDRLKAMMSRGRKAA